MPLQITFSNPRTVAEFTDWPCGREKCCPCRFAVEHHPKKGYRVSRVTTGKPKYTVYAGKSVIVDGSDGRTYVLQLIPQYGAVKIRASDFLDAPEQSYVSQHNESELYQELLAIIMSVKGMVNVG